MIIVMKKGATEEELQAVLGRVEALGYRPHIIRGVERTVVGAVGDERGKHQLQALEVLEGVENVVPILKPYKLASSEGQRERSTVRVGDVVVGGTRVVVFAGPCSVEGREQLLAAARAVKEAGGAVLRGGAYKPRTSPYSFQGMAEEGLKLLAEAREATGLPVVTEVMNTEDAELIAEYADMLQIGARNSQNFPLLKKVGQLRKPVFLKRGMSTTLQEFLMAAEYILSQGNPNVVLCERGIRTFETATRYTLDLSAVPVLREETHLPVVVDPSHASGLWRYVPPLAKAAVAAGADGVMMEVHPKPSEALSDGAQSLKPSIFAQLMGELRAFAEAAGRTL
ncbi:MAG: 3-deoxy-7-phosphoheptulonate synthase [Nitrospinota bacterium]